jgi:hypothetical protein
VAAGPDFEAFSGDESLIQDDDIVITSAPTAILPSVDPLASKGGKHVVSQRRRGQSTGTSR